MTVTAKKGRQKTTWKSEELYHVWAHQRAPEGKSSGVKVYFDGPTIYSYGPHFPMARLLLDKNGNPEAVLVTTQRYSVTTSAHQSDVRSAVRHLKAFHVENVKSDVKPADRLKEYRDRIKFDAESVVRAKSEKGRLIVRLTELIAEANDYAVFFKLKTRFDYPKGFDVEDQKKKGVEEREKADERMRNRDARRQQRDAERLEAARAEYLVRKPEYDAAVAAWLLGVGERFPTLPINPEWGWEVRQQMEREVGVRLRVRGSRLETSMGVIVEIEKAKVLLALVRLQDATGVASYPDAGVDGYRGVTVDYNAKTISVGCHRVKFEEVERIASQLDM